MRHKQISEGGWSRDRVDTPNYHSTRNEPTRSKALFIYLTGYGHITPSTLLSRVFCAFYSFFGIPLFLVTCAGIGDKLRVANNKLEAKLSPKSKSKLVKAGLSLLLFTMGFVLFVFVPAVIFHAMESWDLASSLYFVWITLTTIGFGDLVPGKITRALICFKEHKPCFIQ